MVLDKSHKKYMRLAFAQAQKSGLTTLPNPKVGAVVVQNNKIVGEGHTQAFGGMHAEALALQHADKRSIGGTLYCTLEPCHGTWEGKHQPPCTQLIVNSGIKEVYIASMDPNQKILGKGIDFLKEQGVSVYLISGFNDQILACNEVYYHLHTHPNRPFIHAKIAQTINGVMAKWNPTRVMITDKIVQTHVHALRGDCQALLTGINTVMLDNPQLNVRLNAQKSPLLIVLDSLLAIEVDKNIFKDTSRPIWVFTSEHADTAKADMLLSLGIKIIKVSSYQVESHYYLSLKEVVEYLYTQEIYSLLVEAGPHLVASFLNDGLVDKITTFISPSKIISGKGITHFLNTDLNLAYASSRPIPHTDIIRVEGYTNDVLVEE